MEMFDLPRFADAFGGPVFGYADDETSLTELLQSVGFDARDLSGLSESKSASLLEAYGVDITQLADGELAQLLQGLNQRTGD
jgi:hypothetical protein